MLASAGTASSHREGPSGSKKKSGAASAAEPSEPPIQVQLSAQVHASCASLPSLNLMPPPLLKRGGGSMGMGVGTGLGMGGNMAWYDSAGCHVQQQQRCCFWRDMVL